jgi:hypothetical protein
MRCGAAARTRLAVSSNWRAPIIAVAVVAVLSLGVLAASLVKLAGGSSSTIKFIRSTVIVPVAPTSTTTTPPSTRVPGASTPGTTPAAPTSPGTTTLSRRARAEKAIAEIEKRRRELHRPPLKRARK